MSKETELKFESVNEAGGIAGFAAPPLLGITSNNKIGGFTHDRDLENGKEEWLTPPEIIKALCDFDLDPFAGSGTTLKAAKELNRHWLGIEINAEYLPIIHGRLAQDVLPLMGGGGAEPVTKYFRRHEGEALNDKVSRRADNAGGAHGKDSNDK